MPMRAAHIRERLLHRLFDAEAPVSGQRLATELGISRTAVWKHVRALQARGLAIAAMPGKGYRLDGDPLIAAAIEARLKGCRIRWRVRVVDETGSTNRDVMLAAERGEPEGLALFARRQHEGRGRMGRRWHTLPDSLAFSVLLRPGLPPERMPMLSLVAAVAAHEAIAASAPEARIKWPNDILHEGRKLAGILTEMRAEPGRVHAAAIGIGVNLAQPAGGWPEDIAPLAADLASIAARPPRRSQLAADLLRALDHWLARFREEGFAPVREAWLKAHGANGQRVRAHDGEGYIEGVAAGLDDDGALLLDTGHGLRRVIAGELEPMEARS